MARRALTLIRERYADFGPTLACEKLRECHGLTLSKETVRHLMTDAGLWIPRRQRPPKICQPRRSAIRHAADRGHERITQASALLKAQGWRIIDERCTRDGPRLMAATIIAERPT